MNKYRDQCAWQITVDMDEYVVIPGDNKENFLKRLIEKYSGSYDQVLLGNYLVAGEDTFVQGRS